MLRLVESLIRRCVTVGICQLLEALVVKVVVVVWWLCRVSARVRLRPPWVSPCHGGHLGWQRLCPLPLWQGCRWLVHVAALAELLP